VAAQAEMACGGPPAAPVSSAALQNGLRLSPVPRAQPHQVPRVSVGPSNAPFNVPQPLSHRGALHAPAQQLPVPQPLQQPLARMTRRRSSSDGGRARAAAVCAPPAALAFQPDPEAARPVAPLDTASAAAAADSAPSTPTAKRPRLPSDGVHPSPGLSPGLIASHLLPPGLSTPPNSFIVKARAAAAAEAAAACGVVAPSSGVLPSGAADQGAVPDALHLLPVPE
jgi:hypothetical protein